MLMAGRAMILTGNSGGLGRIVLISKEFFGSAYDSIDEWRDVGQVRFDGGLVRSVLAACRESSGPVTAMHGNDGT